MTVRRLGTVEDLLAAVPGSVPDAAAAFLADGRNVAFAAYDEGEPVGFVRAVVLTRPDDVRPQVFLYDITVAETVRRRGHGRALVRALLDECAALGASEMFVLTNRSNAAAMLLYTSTGATSDAATTRCPWSGRRPSPRQRGSGRAGRVSGRGSRRRARRRTRR